MQPQTYEQLAAVEDQHWWHRSRERLLAHYLRRMKLPLGAAILDVGCGTGGTTRFLQQYGRVTGLERSPLAISHARAKAPQATIVEGDANDLVRLFPPRSFDLVTLLHVLCHQWVPDELALLRKIYTVLKPGGFVLITDGAHRSLMRTHDRLVMSRTRYTLGDLERYFQSVGFISAAGQYFGAPALPICWAVATAGRWWGKHPPAADAAIAELRPPSRMVNAAMTAYMTVENWLFRHLRASFGITLLAIGRKCASAPAQGLRTDLPAAGVAVRRPKAARPAAPVLTR